MVRVEDSCLLTDHLNKVDQSDYRKITIHSKKVVVGQSTARKKKQKNNNNNKNNRLLKTKSSIIDSKRFSRNQSVSADYVFLLKTLHIQHLGDFFLIQAAVLSFTSNFVATAIAALCYCPAPLFTLTDLLYRKHRLSSAGSKVLSSWFHANKLSINIKDQILFYLKQNKTGKNLTYIFQLMIVKLIV